MVTSPAISRRAAIFGVLALLSLLILLGVLLKRIAEPRLYNRPEVEWCQTALATNGFVTARLGAVSAIQLRKDSSRVSVSTHGTKGFHAFEVTGAKGTECLRLVWEAPKDGRFRVLQIWRIPRFGSAEQIWP